MEITNKITDLKPSAFDEVVLASGSPRRREILSQIGMTFRVVVSNDEESPKSNNPLDFPRENASAKALSVSAKERDSLVLGFDTLVFLDGEPLGKPGTPEKSGHSGLELVNGIEPSTCSLRKPDQAVFTCVHMCPQVAVRKGFRAFWPFHGFTQISAKNRKSGNRNHFCGCVQLGDFSVECRNSI